MEIITINTLKRIYEKNSLDTAHEIIISKYLGYIKTVYNLDFTGKIEFPESIPDLAKRELVKLIIMSLITYEKEIRGRLLYIPLKNIDCFTSFVNYFINEGFNWGRLIILVTVVIISGTQKYFDDYAPLQKAITKNGGWGKLHRKTINL